MAGKVAIPKSEFKKRWAALQQKMAEADIDVLIAHGDEADPSMVRYLADYWPLFETGGGRILVHAGDHHLREAKKVLLTFAAARINPEPQGIDFAIENTRVGYGLFGCAYGKMRVPPLQPPFLRVFAHVGNIPAAHLGGDFGLEVVDAHAALPVVAIELELARFGPGLLALVGKDRAVLGRSRDLHLRQREHIGLEGDARRLGLC